jgi:hypothetical protein
MLQCETFANFSKAYTYVGIKTIGTTLIFGISIEIENLQNFNQQIW